MNEVVFVVTNLQTDWEWSTVWRLPDDQSLAFVAGDLSVTCGRPPERDVDVRLVVVRGDEDAQPSPLARIDQLTLNRLPGNSWRVFIHPGNGRPLGDGLDELAQGLDKDTTCRVRERARSYSLRGGSGNQREVGRWIESLANSRLNKEPGKFEESLNVLCRMALAEG